MKTRLLIIVGIVTAILVSLLVSDQYYLSLQDQELKKSDLVQNCVPVGSDGIVLAIGLFNHTHSFDLQTCSWKLTEHGTSGFLESLYISFIEPIFLDIVDSLEIKYAYVDCNSDINYDIILENSELVFTGTVTRLDNYDSPQKVTFFIHEVIKGEINTQKYILENSGKIFLEDGSTRGSSISVDYKIGKTYKVYVENGETNQCTTKITTPPADYMWEPGPEDGNYYSANPVWVDPCDEGYGSSDGVCITLEEMNKDLPTCDPNPKHDFGKCKRVNEEPDNTLDQVLDFCNSTVAEFTIQKSWWNTTHYIDNIDCEFLDKFEYPPPRLEPEPEPEPMIDGKFPPGAIVDCIGGFHFNGTNCVPDDLVESSTYTYYLPLYSIPIGIIIISIISLVIFVYWRKRK